MRRGITAWFRKIRESLDACAVQGRSQDFSEGLSQEPRQQRRRRGVWRVHASSTQMLASFPGARPTVRNAQAQFNAEEHCARRGRRGGLGTKPRKCTESSQLTFDRIMLVPRTPNAEHHSYSLLQARSVASRTRHTANRSLGALSSSTL